MRKDLIKLDYEAQAEETRHRPALGLPPMAQAATGFTMSCGIAVASINMVRFLGLGGALFTLVAAFGAVSLAAKYALRWPWFAAGVGVATLLLCLGFCLLTLVISMI